MPHVAPDVAANIRHLQAQINELATAVLGPISVGPGQGSIRFVDAQGRDLIRLTPEVASVPVNGTHRSISEAFETQILRSDMQDGRMDRQDGRMDRIDAAWKAGDAADQARMDRIDAAWQAGDAADQARMDRIDSAWKAGVAAAQARADAAYALARTANNAARSAQITANNSDDRVDDLVGLTNAIRNATNNLATAMNQAQVVGGVIRAGAGAVPVPYLP